MQLFFVDDRRRTLTPPLTRALGAQQILIGDDVGPVVCARVMHAHQHLRKASERGEDFERLPRQT